MFEVGVIELVAFVPLRVDGFVARAVFPGFFDDADVPLGTVFVAALVAGDLFAGDLLVPGLAAVPLRDRAGLVIWRMAAGAVAGSVAMAPDVGWVVMDPNAAWTVANASSSESWRVSTVTFMRCSWAGKSGDVRSQCRTRGDVAASILAFAGWFEP
jgi:hypothetical protein